MSEYIHISNLCCIGGLCESFIFADIFQKDIRVQLTQ